MALFQRRGTSQPSDTPFKSISCKSKKFSNIILSIREAGILSCKGKIIVFCGSRCFICWAGINQHAGKENILWCYRYYSKSTTCVLYCISASFLLRDLNEGLGNHKSSHLCCMLGAQYYCRLWLKNFTSKVFQI